MKAIRIHEFGAPEVMKVEDTPELKPTAGQVLVRIKAAGVNPVETYIRAGLFYKKDLPFTPGSDGAGIIEAAGEGVTDFKPGDRVYTAGSLSGTYAEFALCRESQVHKLADALTFQQGACIGVPYATAYRALFHRARALPGEKALIHGATGGVGIAAVQLARAHGMTVVGTGGTQKGRELAGKEGAHFTLDHHSPHMEEAVRLARGEFDVIIEFLANANLGRDLEALSRHGRVVVVGSRGTVEIDPREAMSRDADILGMTLFNATEKEISSIHAALKAGFENKTLRPQIGREMALKDAPLAHHAILEESAYGKIVLLP